MRTASLLSTLLLATSTDAFGSFGKKAPKAAVVPAGTRAVGKGPKAKAAPAPKKSAGRAKFVAKKEAPIKKETKVVAKKEAPAAKKAAFVKKTPAKKVAAKKVVAKPAAAKSAPKPKKQISSGQAPLSAARKAADPSDRLVVTDLAGILPPVGLFDPLGFSSRATPDLLRKYREAELTHGRIAMIASVGFFVGEGVQGATPLFDGNLKGAGVAQVAQVPPAFWVSLFVGTFAIETFRVQRMIEDPTTASPEKFGRYRKDWVAGDLGFDPLGLRPSDPVIFKEKQTKELQNGRLAMLAVSGFLAQELTDNKGIIEHVLSLLPPLPDLPF